MATLDMPKPGASQAEWDAYYTRLKSIRDAGEAGQSATPLPGETLEQFQQRLADTGQWNAAQNPTQASDAYKLYQLQQQEKQTSTNALDEQTALQKQRLTDLASFLSSEENRKFNEAIPDIANTAQNSGFLETSGFGNALANKRASLIGDTNAQLIQQGLADRDLQIKGVGDIATNENNLATGGLQRNYSTEDQTASNALAKELARLGVPAPTKSPSTTDQALMYAGPILSGIGSLK